jgi:hypothetical protein
MVSYIKGGIYLVNGTNYGDPYFEAFSTPHSHPSRAQIFASGTCFQIHLACIPPLTQDTMFHNWQYYCFIYFNFRILREISRRLEFGLNNMNFLL